MKLSYELINGIFRVYLANTECLFISRKEIEIGNWKEGYFSVQFLNNKLEFH